MSLFAFLFSFFVFLHVLWLVVFDGLPLWERPLSLSHCLPHKPIGELHEIGKHSCAKLIMIIIIMVNPQLFWIIIYEGSCNRSCKVLLWQGSTACRFCVHLLRWLDQFRLKSRSYSAWEVERCFMLAFFLGGDSLSGVLLSGIICKNFKHPANNCKEIWSLFVWKYIWSVFKRWETLK